MNTLQTIKVNPRSFRKDFDPTLLENISWSNAPFRTHQEIAKAIHGKNPYTVTVLIEPLKWELKNRDLKQGGLFMQWDPWHTQRIEIIQYD